MLRIVVGPAAPGGTVHRTATVGSRPGARHDADTDTSQLGRPVRPDLAVLPTDGAARGIPTPERARWERPGCRAVGQKC